MGAAKATASKTTSADLDWRTYPDLPIPPILAAALEHFHQRGYHGTSIRSIATGVDLTMPTLYYHYGNKEGILYALLEIALDDIQLHMDLCLQEAGDDILQGFKNLVTTVGLHYTNRRDLAMLHDEFRFLDTDFREKYVSRRSIVDNAIEDLLTRGIAEGIFTDEDPHFTTRIIQGMLAGILDWYKAGGPLSAAEIADRYTSSALRIVTRSSS